MHINQVYRVKRTGPGKNRINAADALSFSLTFTLHPDGFRRRITREMWRTGVVLYLLAALGLVQTLNFDDFGAISDEDTWRAAQHNARALLLAVDQANSTSAADRTVSFPGQKTYFLTNVTFDGLVDVTFDIASTIRFSNQVERYNLTEGGGNTSFLMFSNCKHISLIGSGTIDGQGLEWWRLCYLGKNMGVKLAKINEKASN
jgi:hypothetical protein